ncbi:MAG: hypothetical protein JWP66_1531, partial [Naasia sp.]|nr:hypothetical protein [Naasia sp.]
SAAPVPPMERPTPPTASEPQTAASVAPAAPPVADRTAVLPTTSDATTERLAAPLPEASTPPAPRRGARPAKKTE